MGKWDEESKSKKVVNVIGVHQRSEGYPNILFLLQELEQRGSLEYKEFNVPMWSESLSSNKLFIKKAKFIYSAIFSHIKVLYFIFTKSPLESVYIPYPSIFISAALRFFPQSRKPKFLVVDAFISIYDSAIIDRKLFKKNGIIAKFLKTVEKLAFEQADVVITDTNQNSLYYSEIFDLPESNFVSVPLAIDEKNFNLKVASKNNSTHVFNIIFIGNLSPLHGVETIIKAAELLIKHKDIQFTIIGDGQVSSIVEGALNKGLTNIKWIREWQSSKELASHLSEANLGLGIFGAGNKTQRVCPFKVYLYMSCGLPVITGSTQWTRQALGGLDYVPFMTVDVCSHRMLADKIMTCYQSTDACSELSSNSYSFYKNELANSKTINDFENIFYNS